MNSNRYPGTCACGTYVPAGEGFYNGSVVCSPEKWEAEVYEYDGETVVVDMTGCESIRRVQARQMIISRRRIAEVERGLADDAYTSDDPEAQLVIDRRRAERDDPARLARIAEMEARTAAEDAALAARGLVRCDRCGGAGRHEQWRSTGYACFKCDGHGAVVDTNQGVK